MLLNLFSFDYCIHQNGFNFNLWGFVHSECNIILTLHNCTFFLTSLCVSTIVDMYINWLEEPSLPPSFTTLIKILQSCMINHAILELINPMNWSALSALQSDRVIKE